MLYVTPPINTFSLYSITVNSELAHLWIRLLKSTQNKRNGKKKNQSIYSILYFDPRKVWVCFRKKRKETCNHNKANTMQSFIIIFNNGLQAAL